MSNVINGEKKEIETELPTGNDAENQEVGVGNQEEQDDPFKKINEKMAKLAAQKSDLIRKQKEKDEKQRRKDIFTIGEYIEHLNLLKVDREFILGILVEATNVLKDEAKFAEIKMIGSEEMVKFNTSRDEKSKSKK